ncbi:MAG: type II toxin-antitoxin system VapC family toxin [bacterium]|nr:type II toxin-antitoxin system VapC family toxin [bacterium]
MSPTFLDTSAYSAFKRGHDDIRRRIQTASRILVNPVVLGELRAGFLKGTLLDKNLTELSDFLAAPRVRVVAIDEETAERYAVILRSLQKAGQPIPTNDVWIAASAMQHGARLLTIDHHFERVQQVFSEIFLP